MESVLFEKGRLVSQWRASLAALAKRDEALQVASRALTLAFNPRTTYPLVQDRDE